MDNAKLLFCLWKYRVDSVTQAFQVVVTSHDTFHALRANFFEVYIHYTALLEV
jgi:hypothetical protein